MSQANIYYFKNCIFIARILNVFYLKEFLLIKQSTCSCFWRFFISLTCRYRSNIYLASNRSSMECPTSQSPLPTHSQSSTLNPQSSIHNVKVKDSWWLLPARILQWMRKVVCQRPAIWKKNPQNFWEWTCLFPKLLLVIVPYVVSFWTDITGHCWWRGLFGVFSTKQLYFSSVHQLIKM